MNTDKVNTQLTSQSAIDMFEEDSRKRPRVDDKINNNKEQIPQIPAEDNLNVTRKFGLKGLCEV